MLFALFKAALLTANGCAILHESRFLSLYDLHVVDQLASDQGQIKPQISGMLHATRVLRLPLVLLNLISIVLIVLFG
jgi:hypothetical protein